MSQQIVLFDAWLCEAEEANQLAEDIESRIREWDSVMAVGGDPYHIVSGARRKLMVLGAKLDRLESLLQNPPAKPVLNERDLHFRQAMILDIQQRTKQMAVSLCTSPPSNKPNVRDGKASLQVVDTDKATSPNNHGIASFQGQSTKDEELLHSKVTESDTKHMAIAVEDESNLQSPLLDELDKNGDARQSSSWMTSLFVLSRWVSSCPAINLFLIAVAIVILILVIMVVLKSI